MGARPGSKNFDFEPKVWTMNKSVREGDAPPFLELRSTCVERPGSKNFDFDQSLDSEKSRPWWRRAAIFGNFVPPV
ncbi:hypothetical protein TNCV_4330181 [Trichonephila clavipes]|nr:hypothetical protein TNCV_4330181 [Trichonephila clavipes]